MWGIKAKEHRRQECAVGGRPLHTPQTGFARKVSDPDAGGRCPPTTSPFPQTPLGSSSAADGLGLAQTPRVPPDCPHVRCRLQGLHRPRSSDRPNCKSRSRDLFLRSPPLLAWLAAQESTSLPSRHCEGKHAGTGMWKTCTGHGTDMRAKEVPLSLGAQRPPSASMCSPRRSSLNPAVREFLWRFHSVGIVSEIAGCWWPPTSLPSPERGDWS